MFIIYIFTVLFGVASYIYYLRISHFSKLKREAQLKWSQRNMKPTQPTLTSSIQLTLTSSIQPTLTSTIQPTQEPSVLSPVQQQPTTQIRNFNSNTTFKSTPSQNYQDSRENDQFYTEPASTPFTQQTLTQFYTPSYAPSYTPIPSNRKRLIVDESIDIAKRMRIGERHSIGVGDYSVNETIQVFEQVI